MRLLSIRLENFGLFGGVHNFDLAPRHRSGEILPLTVFVGHNGAGKTTLFTALMLAFHGPLALGDRVGQAQYNDFLYSRMHRRHKDGSHIVCSSSSVALSFEYIQSGFPKRVHIERRWQRNGRIVNEVLEVLRDGVPISSEVSDSQAWINDLIPLGLARLCFFDAENLDSLAGADNHGQKLGETLQRLLGLDLIQRLQADLKAYLLREGGNAAVEEARVSVLTLQAELETLYARLASVELDARKLSERADTLQSLIYDQERSIAAAGGLYAARRSVQQERLIENQKEVASVLNQINDLATHLLPFALAPRLSDKLSAKLHLEADIQRKTLAHKYLIEKISLLDRAISDDAFWAGLSISSSIIKVMRERFRAELKIDQQVESEDISILHQLADPERNQLQGWICNVRNDVPDQAQAIGLRLRGLQEERRVIETDLSRAPGDEQLAPLHTALTEFQTELNIAMQERNGVDQKIGALRYEHETKDREMQRAIEVLRQAQASEQEMVRAERCRSALRVYEDTLTRQRVFELEQALVRSFNRLCHKENLLSRAAINPNDFKVYLEGADGGEVSITSFSAGERQLYALAILHSLREVSGRQLPLLIDTPLARLDEHHRLRLLHDYIPIVSDQMLLFATDTEADATFFTQAEPYISHVYRLRFNESSGETESIKVKTGVDFIPEMEVEEITNAV